MSKIPIAAAKRIAKEYGIDQVVILGRVPESEPGKGDGSDHVTTYGRTLVHCDIAAQMGNKLKRILGWPPDQCNAKPARLKGGYRMTFDEWYASASAQFPPSEVQRACAKAAWDASKTAIAEARRRSDITRKGI